MENSIKKIMTSPAVSVRPDTPLMQAANLLISKGYSGLPVVDPENHVIGILTEYDLIIKGSSLHLPTFIKILKEIDLYGKDALAINKDLKQLMAMKTSDAMNVEPMTILNSASIDEVAKIFSEHHKVNPLVVVDTENTLVGIVSRRDLVRLFGTYTIHHHDERADRPVDVSVNSFLKRFDNTFIVVSRFRTKTWLLFSALFFVIGFVTAFALIVRVRL